jgi:hypothetical protein
MGRRDNKNSYRYYYNNLYNNNQPMIYCPYYFGSSGYLDVPRPAAAGGIGPPSIPVMRALKADRQWRPFQKAPPEKSAEKTKATGARNVLRKAFGGNTLLHSFIVDMTISTSSFLCLTYCSLSTIVALKCVSIFFVEAFECTEFPNPNDPNVLMVFC